ncbi:MAG TPA: prepilin-type N-terminal cleavage/methylation domain-containing protein [Gemmatimonadaceae bacterium]
MPRDRIEWLMRENHAGLTLIEVIVAMLLFATGALALAATSASVARQMRSNDLRAQASFIARDRAEKAIASGCLSLGSGTQSRGDLVETWTVRDAVAPAVEQDIQRASPSGMHSDHFESAVQCR